MTAADGPDRRAAVPEVSDPHRDRAGQPAGHSSCRPPRCCANSNGCSGRRRAASTARSPRCCGTWRFPRPSNGSSRAMPLRCEEVQRVGGVTPGDRLRGRQGSAAGRLMHVKGPGLQAPGEWCALTLAPACPPARRLRARPVHHHAALHPGDDARHRCRRDPVPARKFM